MPKLTVVMPTYNGEKFLRAQIDSILGQSDPDFALIVIDDGSTDATVAIVDDYARRDGRVRRLPSTGNKGQIARLIELLGAARSEYLAIADQDDVWDRHRNERLFAAIGSRAIALGRSQLIDDRGADLGKSVLEAFDVDARRVGRLGALILPLTSAHATIIRRDWINPGAFYGVLPFDRALGLEALFSTGFVYVDDAIVHHRMHGSNQLNGDAVRPRGSAKLLSPYRLRASFGFVRPSRLWFAQTLDQLGRSSSLDPATRATFRTLAGKCWHYWHGSQPVPRALEDEFHEALDRYASSADDLAFFSANLRSLMRSAYSLVNLRIGWDLYHRDAFQLAHTSVGRSS